MPSTAALSRVDLNLLTAFRAVEEARHVTRAARLLGVSQPALSQALRRLRETFRDPLFVRTPRGMVLTPFAESLAKPVREILARIEHEVFEHRPFRPSDLSRTFRIRATDFLEGLLTPALLTTLAAEAPGVRVALLPVPIELPKEELESGACDLAIAGFFGDLPDTFHRQLLLEDTFACAVRREHPRIPKRSLTLDAFCAEKHVLVAPSGELSGAVDRALRRRRRARTVVLGTSGFMSAAWLASRADVVVTAPLRLLSMLAKPFGLVTFAPPVDLPAIKIVQIWHERSHADPAHQWLRGLVRTSLA